MTKRNLLLVGLFVFFGIVAMAPSALAQTTWTVPAPVALTSGRAEGKAEATAPVKIALQTGGYVSANSYFIITYSAPITNIGLVAGTATVTCGSTAQPAAGPWASGACVNLSPLIIATVNILTIQFSALTTFTTGDGSYLSVTVRVDASGVTPLPGQVTAAVYATLPPSGYAISVSPTTGQEVLAVNAKPSLVLQYDPYKDTLVDKGTPADVLTCIGVEEGTPNGEFIINIAEAFSYALTTQAQEMIWAPVEGFNGASPPDVTNGSNLVFTFSNVPAEVGIQAKDIEPCSTLNTSDPLYCPNGTLALTLTSPNVVPPSTNGWASFTYSVSHLDAGSAENVSLWFLFWSNGPLPSGLPPMTVNVAYSPIHLVLPSTLPDPSPIPYFTGVAEAATALPVVNFGDCVTYLLFPYVNTFMAGGTAAFANFGTGIAFANTTADPFGSNPATAGGSAVPQTGSCTVYLYPANGKATVVYTTPVISSGQSWAFDVGSSVPGFAGNTGYAIAICNFQNAYGFEEVYDNYGIAAPTATLGLYGYILPNPTFYPRSGAGAAPAGSAIAPAITNKVMQKLLYDLGRK